MKNSEEIDINFENDLISDILNYKECESIKKEGYYINSKVDVDVEYINNGDNVVSYNNQYKNENDLKYNSNNYKTKPSVNSQTNIFYENDINQRNKNNTVSNKIKSNENIKMSRLYKNHIKNKYDELKSQNESQNNNNININIVNSNKNSEINSINTKNGKPIKQKKKRKGKNDNNYDSNEDSLLSNSSMNSVNSINSFQFDYKDLDFNSIKEELALFGIKANANRKINEDMLKLVHSFIKNQSKILILI